MRTLTADLLTLRGDLDALRDQHHLSPDQLEELVNDDHTHRTLANHLNIRLHALRLRALELQAAAAEALFRSLSELPSPNDRRKAATTLARLTTAILTGMGGRGSRSGARQEGADEPSTKPQDHTSSDDDIPDPTPNFTTPQSATHHVTTLIPRAHKNPALLTTLLPHLAPNATLLSEPIPQDPTAFLNTRAAQTLLAFSHAPWSQPLAPPPNADPELHAVSFLRLGTRHHASGHTLTLTRPTPTSPWQIAALNAIPP